MDISTSKLESIIGDAFKEQDEWIARILNEAFEHHTPVAGWKSALAWASGNIGNKLPKTGEILFDFIEKFERCDDCGAEFLTTCDHSASCKYVETLEYYVGDNI